jgi:uncharacterized protein with HEPN domain
MQLVRVRSTNPCGFASSNTLFALVALRSELKRLLEADIARMRDPLTHRCFDNSHSILQATVDYDIPALKDAILSLLQQADKA